MSQWSQTGPTIIIEMCFWFLLLKSDKLTLDDVAEWGRGWISGTHRILNNSLMKLQLPHRHDDMMVMGAWDRSLTVPDQYSNCTAFTVSLQHSLYVNHRLLK